MIEFLNTWAKNLGLAIVVISILEMLLPNNKIKKYIRMVMGIYILFCILSPWIGNQDMLKEDIEELKNSISTQTANTQTTVNQTSMDERIQELYVEELENDITKKLEEKGYELCKCKVEATISDKEEDTKITKIKIKVEKKIEIEKNSESNEQTEEIENKIVTQIQKIKTIDTNIQKEEKSEETTQGDDTKKITKVDIQNIKKFLMEEYGVKEKCLEIS